jgi:hypothetical protein
VSENIRELALKFLKETDAHESMGLEESGVAFMDIRDLEHLVLLAMHHGMLKAADKVGNYGLSGSRPTPNFLAMLVRHEATKLLDEGSEKS